MKENDSKTVNGITVVIHYFTDTTVYFIRFRGVEWDGGGWPFYQMDRSDFERLWEEEI